MPAKTHKQQRYMAGCADPKSRKQMKNCPPTHIAKEFAHFDGKKRRSVRTKAGDRPQ